MPLDASDRIRKIEEITRFGGFVAMKAVTQPGVNVSSCATFYTSTVQQYKSYDSKYKIEEGRVYFSTSQSK